MIEQLLKDREIVCSDNRNETSLALPGIIYHVNQSDEMLRLSEPDESGEFDAPYEDNELVRPFSEDYDSNTLDMIAMRKIGRMEYGYSESAQPKSAYEPNYEDTEPKINDYFSLDEDDNMIKDMMKYERPQEKREAMFKKIIEMFKKSEAISANEEQEETHPDKVLKFEQKQDEEDLEYKLVA
jgi:hypothetical protein